MQPFDRNTREDIGRPVNLLAFRSPRVNWHPGNDVRLLKNGIEFFPALCDAFDAATLSIHMETYIFRLDRIGNQVLDHLLQAAKRGIKVRVVLDGFGCAAEEKYIQNCLQAAGAQCRIFRPEPKQFGFNSFNIQRLRRLHRKITVIDSRLGFVGGINIEDDYATYEPGAASTEPRFDYALSLTGPAIPDLVHAQQLLWLGMSRLDETTNEIIGVSRGARLWRALRLKKLSFQNLRKRSNSPARTGKTNAAIILRDNFRHRKSIEAAYLTEITHARHDIIIANAYFLPGHKLRKALIQAVRRGVRVRLLLQGKIEYRMQYFATRWIYDRFLRAGVEIYEYTPSFLHAKVAVIDNISTVGSSNLDPFSLLLAREANVLIDDREFSAKLRDSLQGAMEHGSHIIEHTLYVQQEWFPRLGDACAYLLLRIGIALSGKNEDY
jgi:cardiolipin synthase